jgi:hypothetical protein
LFFLLFVLDMGYHWDIMGGLHQKYFRQTTLWGYFGSFSPHMNIVTYLKYDFDDGISPCLQLVNLSQLCNHWRYWEIWSGPEGVQGLQNGLQHGQGAPDMGRSSIRVIY